MARNRARLYADLDAIYARLPGVECRGACWGSCGPIPMADLERQRAEEAHGGPVGTGPDLLCNCLTPDRRCSIYDARPFVCRAYGAVPGLMCPFGCQPDRALSVAESFEIVTAVERVAGAAGMRHVMVDGQLIPADEIRAAVISTLTRAEEILGQAATAIYQEVRK